MQLTRQQLDTLCALATEAGREIMDVYGNDTIVAITKEDTSPLTQADLRSDAVIRRGLQAAFAGVFIQSEEAVAADPGGTRTFFLVDPLDGTKEFIKRNGEFTVNIALIHEGEAVAGVVFAPALGEMYCAARGLGAWKGEGANAVPLATQVCSSTSTLRVIGSRSHGGDALAAWLAKLSQPHEFVAAGSSLKFCRIAEGKADIYPRHGPTSQWDTAAAQAVLQEAGGCVLDADGKPLAYGLDLPVLNRYFVALGDPTLQYPPIA
ncbi:3'(2'),5'-bisphosphate nucleotidase CysQ [Caenimonas sp. SL110]|uniref:3'(2'),5'-bisphosphate nucleotidase CysQ n=1 Tax=Caenimonas sp. SL110 TaxID=1450524 RepID=UPI000652CC45|nr:3'(2'),5'-bisphosphate nucleotidase CysQ [Caenimonas sp. SL110]